MPAASEVRISVRPRVTCPHCWETFSADQTHWVAAHPDLVNDPRLTSDHQLRFLPTRFNVEGNALDPRGMACQELACPRCHLTIPRSLLELPPLFVSIAGTPSCGKSYFLAAMTWSLRQTLPRDFQVSYTDADPQSNLILAEYEEQQFLNPRQDEVVKLRKTEEQGDAYDQVRYGSQVVSYPRPFLFSIRPTQQHPSVVNARRASRLLCLYDNAGESFLPGRDTVVNPVTRHLAQSHAVIFCFDPTQDPRFRNACAGQSTDFQVQEAPVTARQETVLHEIINRIRNHTGLKQTERRQQPLIVAVTKCDAWWSLMNVANVPPPWKPIPGSPMRSALDLSTIKKLSLLVRQLLSKFTPELVAAAEEFSEQTWFIPVSATGCSPERAIVNRKTVWGVKPRNIRPMWCEVPLLTILATQAGGLVPSMKMGPAMGGQQAEASR
ncbi:hypothetical protein [Aeoliella sp. SH292]|uniref:hypothetical protein n=1 Tax=Aeoliella sp. SH292 TaxID=3454464 RepID=UPI003F97E1ED